MNKNSKKKGTYKQFHMKMTPEEYKLLGDIVESRGISATAFVKQRIFNIENDSLYNREVEMAIHTISELLLEGVPEYCENEEFIQKCQNEVNKLWLCLH